MAGINLCGNLLRWSRTGRICRAFTGVSHAAVWRYDRCMNWQRIALVVPSGALCLAVTGLAVTGLAVAGWSGPALAQANEAGSASLAVTVTGIKNSNGVVRLALCPAGAKFPDCGKQATRTETLPIEGGQARITLTGLAPGSYAVSVFHDANNNNKLDTFAGIPREGYGFSNNPAFQPRAPRFSETAIAVSGADTANISLRYIL